MNHPPLLRRRFRHRPTRLQVIQLRNTGCMRQTMARRCYHAYRQAPICDHQRWAIIEINERGRIDGCRSFTAVRALPRLCGDDLLFTGVDKTIDEGKGCFAVAAGLAELSRDGPSECVDKQVAPVRDHVEREAHRQGRFRFPSSLRL